MHNFITYVYNFPQSDGYLMSSINSIWGKRIISSSHIIFGMPCSRPFSFACTCPARLPVIHKVAFKHVQRHENYMILCTKQFLERCLKRRMNSVSVVSCYAYNHSGND